MPDLGVFSSLRPSEGAGVPSLTAQKAGFVQAVIRSGLLAHFSEQEALFITSLLLLLNTINHFLAFHQR